ncbi:conserved hypothetical protein [Histoplasma capsulatum H143]|uniref:Uncharacterized protein n=1 Tax=Ajellomyces capsulatus (strain H143) TaxID=544712 RepID=C6H1E0_AJECH|nr:conserved hypothetical protein [Histoplasma capsulatum H143]
MAAFRQRIPVMNGVDSPCQEYLNGDSKSTLKGPGWDFCQ